MAQDPGPVHGAPYVPSPRATVDEMLRLAEVGPRDVVYDLGAGDGRVVIAAAAKFGARGVGIEIDEKLVAQARASAERAGVAERVRFLAQDLFATDLREATVVALYLSPNFNEKLRPKLLALAPGTRIVAHDYHFGDWPPDERQTLRVPEKQVGDPGLSYVYLWIVPAQVAGRWRTELAAEGRTVSIEVALKQSFQAISGHAVVDGQGVPLHGAQLHGADVHFALDVPAGASGRRHSFRGRVSGAEIAGVVAVREAGAWRERDWRARRVDARH